MKKLKKALDKRGYLWYDSRVTKKAEHPPHLKQMRKEVNIPPFPEWDQYGVCADALASAFFIIGGAYHSQV